MIGHFDIFKEFSNETLAQMASAQVDSDDDQDDEVIEEGNHIYDDSDCNN